MPLTDVTAIAFNNENIIRQGGKSSAMRATAGLTTPAGTPPPPMRTNNPYSAPVLGSYQSPAMPMQPLNLMDLSNESTSSTYSGGMAAPMISVPVPAQFVLRAPVRREYRNGRPVPVFTSDLVF